VYEKTFTPDFHIAETPFQPLRSDSHPVIVGLDFGRTPAAALMQRNAFGQVVILAELTSENMGIETFLTSKLGPLLTEARFLGCNVVVAPDPAGYYKQQIGEVSPVDVVRSAGYVVVRPGTNDPERRIEAVERVLLDHIEGKPAMVVNPECTTLIKGFRYGYRYKLNRSGVQDNKPDKNSFSHVHDACQYGAMVCATGAGTGKSMVARRREVVVKSAVGWT